MNSRKEKNTSKRQDLTQGNLKKQILFLTLPMILAMLGMVMFNFVDTLYIGMLGETELAAVAFTFPVVMVVQAISQGLAMGTGSVVSAYVGKKDENGIRNTTVYSLILSFIIVVVASIIGSFTINPLFSAMGATENELIYIRAYMRIWYIGMPFVVFPMVSNNIIRALGDTKTPSFIMMVAVIMNMILDPILIFVFNMGVAGAALATVISRLTTFVTAFYILLHREKVLSFKGINCIAFKASCKRVLFIAVPTTLTRAVMPLGTGVITALIATIGIAEVGGYGAGVKIEQIGFSVIFALSTVMVAVVGQNYGARQFRRIKSAYRIASGYSLLYSLIIIPLFFFTVPFIVQLFDVSDMVREVIVLYVRIAVLGSGFFGILNISTSLLNAVKKPVVASVLFIIQMFVLNIPLAYWLSSIYGIQGVFYALVIAYVVSGIIAYLVTLRTVDKVMRKKMA